jgi:hypothetical protein
MSPTLDETATNSDPQITKNFTRATAILAVYRAVDLDGLPAPRSIRFENDGLRLVMDENAVAEVDDWAFHLRVDPTQQRLQMFGWVRHIAQTGPGRLWHGYPLQVSCAAKTTRAGA